MYLYIFVYVYEYVYICMYVFMNVVIFMHVYKYIYVYMCICSIYVYTYICVMYYCYPSGPGTEASPVIFATISLTRLSTLCSASESFLSSSISFILRLFNFAS